MISRRKAMTTILGVAAALGLSPYEALAHKAPLPNDYFKSNSTRKDVMKTLKSFPNFIYFLDPKTYGAVGNDSHNDGPNIQNCWNAAAVVYDQDGVSIDVQMSPGFYRTRQPLYLPTKLINRGTGAGWGTWIRAAPNNFPTGGTVVNLGDGHTISVFGCRLENMTIDCNNIPGSVGVAGEALNEACGMRGGSIINYMSAGIYVISPGNGYSGSFNALFSDLQVYASATAPNNISGIVVQNIGAPVCDLHLFRITVTSQTPKNTYAGVNVIGLNNTNPAILWAEDVHVEACDNGIFFDNYGGGHVIGVRQEPSVLNSATISASSYPVFLGNISGTIQDNQNGVTKPGPTALYSTEGVFAGGLTLPVKSAPPVMGNAYLDPSGRIGVKLNGVWKYTNVS